MKLILVSALAVAALVALALSPVILAQDHKDHASAATKPEAGDNLKPQADQLAAALKSLDAIKDAIAKNDSKTALAELEKARTAVTSAHQALVKLSGGAFVNVRCPMKLKDIDLSKVPANLVREYKGKKIAFCCNGCPEAWDKLSDTEKDAKLKAAVDDKSSAAPADGKKFANAKCPIMGSKINPDNVTANLVREYKGKKIAFCCDGCPQQWDKLSDEQKEAKLKAAE